MSARSTMRVGVSADLLTAAGQFSFGSEPIAILDGARDILSWELLPKGLRQVTPDISSSFDGLYLNTPSVSEDSLSPDGRLKVVARHGVGYDSVDVNALTLAGILLTNTPLAVRRPVAAIALTFMLALAHRLFEKDRLTRSGRWHERTEAMGTGLTGRTLGLVGAGGIGREIARVVAPFGMTVIAFDPYVAIETARAAGMQLVPLSVLMERSDFVVVACLLNEETRHIINASMLALMKSSSYLINVARGSVVDEAALIEVLRNRRIAGAALDVFEQEPVNPDNLLLTMPNAILTPHSLCWTDECFGAIARTALTSIVDVLSRRVPQHVVNPNVLEHPRLKSWFDSPEPGRTRAAG